MQALNLLTVLSYGDSSGDANASHQHMHHHHQTGTSAATNANATANENELLVDNVPGLLDALYRQLVACRLLPSEKELSSSRREGGC